MPALSGARAMYCAAPIRASYSLGLGEDTLPQTKATNGNYPNEQVTPTRQYLSAYPSILCQTFKDPRSWKRQHRTNVVVGSLACSYSPTPVSDGSDSRALMTWINIMPTLYNMNSAYELVSVESRSLPFQGLLMQAKPAILLTMACYLQVRVKLPLLTLRFKP